MMEVPLMSTSFDELESRLKNGTECILALSRDKDGGITIAKIYEEGDIHSVGYSMALIDQQAHPDLLYIKALV